MCVLCCYTQAPHLQIGSWNILQRFLSQSEAPMLQWNKGIGWKPENLDQDRPDPKTLKTPESCKTEQKTEQKTLQHISKSEFAEFYYVLFYTCISIYLNWICETSRELAAQIWFQQRVSTLVRNFAHNQMSQFARFKLLLKDVRILQS